MFKLTKEDTGQIGSWHPDHEKSTLATFPTKEEAREALRRHYDAIVKNEKNVTRFGSTFSWQGEDQFTVETDNREEEWVATQIFRIEEV